MNFLFDTAHEDAKLKATDFGFSVFYKPGCKLESNHSVLESARWCLGMAGRLISCAMRFRGERLCITAYKIYVLLLFVNGFDFPDPASSAIRSHQGWLKPAQLPFKPLPPSQAGDLVVNVYINHEKKFAFVDMRTVEEASNAMALDGIVFEASIFILLRRHRCCCEGSQVQTLTGLPLDLLQCKWWIRGT
ncbi:hypothetical protein P8452_16177 [Trifolium repens]|nr:hypothetical protein P8452_16177 [Trifolium repens]